MSDNPIWPFLGIMAVLFVVWIFIGGPQESNTPAFITFDPSSGGWSGSSISSTEVSPAEVTSYSARRQAQREIVDLDDKLGELEREIERARIRGEASPYEGLVRITGLSNPRARLVTEEYVHLSAPYGNPVDITVTGWRLESALTGLSVEIGYAAALPKSGSVNAQAPVILPASGQVFVHSGRSPIGTSFRINKCTGYFEQYQDFNPPLNLSCPYPTEEFERYADVEITNLRREKDKYEICYGFVSRLPQCRFYEDDLDDVRPKLVDACIAFIERELTYSGCVNRHQNDIDFYENTWHVYGGNYAERWRETHDIIRLLDERGRTVSVFSY